MSKHYHYQHGLRRRYRLRTTALPILLLSVFGFGLIFRVYGGKQSSNAPIQAPVQYAAESPAVAVQRLTTPIPWPNDVKAAYAVPKENLFATSEEKEQPVPIASLAKIITVLAVLEKKPLEQGQPGPTITLDQKDAALVLEYAQKSGTTVPVVAGEQITQQQALQAILMVSSNNMSDSLVRWAFGSVEAYVTYANNMLKEQGFQNTIVADDASGFSPSTVSTTEDMAKLGYMYMKHPVLREIALQPRATIPVEGVIPNGNNFANDPGLIGIKLGNTDEAGKCFLAATIRNANQPNEEVSVSVVLGAKDFGVAAQDARAILTAGNKGHDQTKSSR